MSAPETVSPIPYQFVKTQFGQEYITIHPELNQVIERFISHTSHNQLHDLEAHRGLVREAQQLTSVPEMMQAAIDANADMANDFEQTVGKIIGGRSAARESIKVLPANHSDILFCEVLKGQLPFEDVPALIADYERLEEFLTTHNLNSIHFRVPRFIGHVRIPEQPGEGERLIILREYIEGKRLDDPALQEVMQQSYFELMTLLEQFRRENNIHRSIDQNRGNYLYAERSSEIVGIDVFKRS